MSSKGHKHTHTGTQTEYIHNRTNAHMHTRTRVLGAEDPDTLPPSMSKGTTHRLGSMLFACSAVDAVLADHGCSALSLTLPLRSCHLLLLQHNQHQYSSFTSPEMSGHMTQTRVNHDSWPPSLHMSPSLHMVFASTILARRLILSSHTI